MRYRESEPYGPFTSNITWSIMGVNRLHPEESMSTFNEDRTPYAQDPEEREAFIRFMGLQNQILTVLADQPAKTVTTSIAGQGYWLHDGRIFASPDMPIEKNGKPERRHLDSASMVPKRMSVSDMHHHADQIEKWLKNPQFVRLHPKADLKPGWLD